MLNQFMLYVIDQKGFGICHQLVTQWDGYFVRIPFVVGCASLTQTYKNLKELLPDANFFVLMV